MTAKEAHAIARYFGHKCVADFNTGTVQIDDWKPAMTVGEFMAFATGLSERRMRLDEDEPFVIEQIVKELRQYAYTWGGRAGRHNAIGWTCGGAADVIEDLQQKVALRKHSDRHERCDAEISRLRVLVAQALAAWEGSGPPIILDELRNALACKSPLSSGTASAKVSGTAEAGHSAPKTAKKHD